MESPSDDEESVDSVPTSMMTSTKERFREEIMGRIMGTDPPSNIVRMGPKTFLYLCNLLETEGGLEPTSLVSIEEQVAKTLHMLSHTTKDPEKQSWFQSSGEIHDHSVDRVLKSITRLEDKLLKQPDGAHIPYEILRDGFYPYFKDCIGAMGGTHVRVKVHPKDANRYRGRNRYTTQNVLAACTFDLKFTYVLAGWEGSASNSRILNNALSREDRLIIPPGKYYLVDSKFATKSGLIGPYRGVRCHLKEYSRNLPQDRWEMFNLRHASLRNAIDRAFGVLEKRFPIISSSRKPTYGVETQKEIVFACCILHNYLIDVDLDERLIAEVDEELMKHDPPQEIDDSDTDEEDDEEQGQLLRDSIASAMWN